MAKVKDGTLVTQYSNLKGVDFTANPSAVYKRHSPTAVNMISDEGGNPRKRMGWEVKLVSDPDRNEGLNQRERCEVRNFWTFEYNNEAHLILQLAYITVDVDDFGTETYGTPTFKLASYNASANEYNILVESCPENVIGFVVDTTTNNTFCIMYDCTVYTYEYSDGAYTFKAITPKVPRIIIGQPYEGGGTPYEGVNMLGRRVEESFRWESGKNKITLSHDVADGVIEVHIRVRSNDSVNHIWYKRDGSWYKSTKATENFTEIKDEDWTGTTEVSITGNVITIPSGTYTLPVDGEDNTFVTYNLGGTSEMANALMECEISTLYESKVFLTGAKGMYHNYVWWSGFSDPSYFPDTNYAVIGSNESAIVGLVDIGEYLGVVKSATAVSTTVYFMYSTSFENNPAYAVKQFLNGVGAVSPRTFASVSDEQLYLARDGIYAITPNAIKNRSYYVNKKLCSESGLESAVATAWNGYYILCVNSRCYILDTRQKTGWGTEWTNYSYECYFWDNVDAIRFITFNMDLWFIDRDHNLCRFKRFDERHCYGDGNYIQKETIDGVPLWLCPRYDEDGNIVYETVDGHLVIVYDEVPSRKIVDEDGSVTYEKPTRRVPIGSYVDEDGVEQTIYDTVEYGNEIWEQTPAPIYCEWTTPLDDDGAVQLFKTLQKKGTLASVIPQSSTSARLYLSIEGSNTVYIGEQRADRFFFSNVDFNKFTFNSNDTPIDVYFKKKVKKYKRLQIKIVNDKLDEPLTIQGITKTYSVKGYSKKLAQDGQFIKEK